MIQPYTRLKAADNTGARQLMCINVLGGTRKKYARIGDIIVASVKRATPAAVVKKGDVVRIVETRPLSSQKRWRVAEIITKGTVIEVQPEEVT